MTTSLARINVQKPFCSNCMMSIKKKIMEVEQVKNVRLFPADSLVIFNYNRAHQISDVLNTLIALGYPPEGDNISSIYKTQNLCNCAKTLD